MKNEKIIKKYYKTAFHKGKNSLARLMDFIAFRIISYIILYIWFLPMLKNPILHFLLPLIALSALSVAVKLFQSIRFERFCVLEKERIKSRIICDSFLLMPHKELHAAVCEYILTNAELCSLECIAAVFQKTAAVSADDLISVCQNTFEHNLKAAVVFSTSDFSNEASEFIKKHSDEISIYPLSSSALAKHLKYTVDDNAADEYIIAHSTERKKELKQVFAEAFAQNSVKKYFTVAILLTVASFFARYSVYYRVVAAIASSFGFISLYLSKSKPKEN